MSCAEEETTHRGSQMGGDDVDVGRNVVNDFKGAKDVCCGEMTIVNVGFEEVGSMTARVTFPGGDPVLACPSRHAEPGNCRSHIEVIR